MWPVQISLAHFCENDGPTSVLCTEVVKAPCPACPSDRSDASSIRNCAGADKEENEAFRKRSVGRPSTAGCEQEVDEGTFHMADLEEAIKADATAPTSAAQEVHDKTRNNHLQDDQDKVNPLAKQDGGCLSCSISLPEETISRLPSWAPGSPRKDGMGRNGGPIMRTTERVCAHWTQQVGLEAEAAAECKFHHSSPQSFESATSTSSCYPHEYIYWTTSSPWAPNTYSILRRSTIRTLSCEQIHRGLTYGALAFTDPVDGYTVAFKFRLKDPYARGSQRHYALIALMGKNPTHEHRSTAIIWRVFEEIARKLMARAENVIQQGKTAGNGRGGRKPPMSGSSFLTGRAADPDGFPRRNGGLHIRARGLAEMVGDELIFAHLHREFTCLLQTLGRHFGRASFKPSEHPRHHIRTSTSFRHI